MSEQAFEGFVDSSQGAAVKLSDVLTDSEIRPFLVRSDARAAWMFAVNGLIIAGAFAMAVLWPNPLTLVAAVLLLGGRQLGLAVVYHDCSHGVFFRTRWLNDFVGHWIAGGLLNTSMYAYRNYHLKHHRFAGTMEDPDMPLANTYPTTRESLKRKFWRDITGQTGFKTVLGQLARVRLRRNAPFLLSHVCLFTALWLAGAAWAYALWWVAHIFVYFAILRLRFISEHGVAIDRLSPDARDNTSTTVLSWWERLLIGPNYVNFHLEHHLSAAVPCYRLSRLHHLLAQRGFFTNHECLSRGYLDVLGKAVVPAS
ncbi:MAG: fatty acid desaturase family protein [Pseudomonadota bacterium]